jgi:hypothetical protein
MKKNLPFKKKLNEALINKKVIENTFAVLIHTQDKKTLNYLLITKIILHNKYLLSVFKNYKLHFPIKAIFFQEYFFFEKFCKLNSRELIILKYFNFFLKANNFKIYLSPSFYKKIFYLI